MDEADGIIKEVKPCQITGKHYFVYNYAWYITEYLPVCCTAYTVFLFLSKTVRMCALYIFNDRIKVCNQAICKYTEKCDMSTTELII